jgi:hypothetical protein
MDVKGRSPVFDIPTVSGADELPMMVGGKFSEVVERVSVGGAAPVPIRTTVCVPAPSIKVRVPVARKPFADQRRA